MVGEIEANFLVQPLPHEIGTDLPEVVVESGRLVSFVPPTRPARQIEVNPVDVVGRVFGYSLSDGSAITRSRNYPRLMKPADLRNPVPSYPML